MTRLMVCFTLVWVCAGSALSADLSHATGPWTVDRILDRPTPYVVESQTDNLSAIRYPSEPYRGKVTQVFAYYAVPKTGSGPFPAMLLVHGGGGKAFEEWARLWADRGYIALAMDLAGNGADGKPLAGGGPPQDDDTKFSLTASSPIEDTWPYQAVAAVLRGHALLSQQPKVDPTRIGITGISWGGYLTCIVAGIDHRLAVAVPVYGCGFLGENSAWKEAGRFERLPPAARERWLANFDPSQYLAGVQCPILFVNGTNDFAYPLDSYQKSYRLVTSPRALCVTVNMPHGHQAGWAPPEIGVFVDSVLTGGRPLVQLSTCKVESDRLSTTFAASEPPSKAELHFTTDTGRWLDRKWTTVPAEINAAGHVISVELPHARPLACFLTVQDSRGLTVSTEHAAIER